MIESNMTRSNMTSSRRRGVSATAFGACAATVVAMAFAASAARGQAVPPQMQTLPRAELLCAADLPLVHPGESVVVRAWMLGAHDETAAKRWHWRSDLGSIRGAEVATWQFGPGELAKAGNTVTATVEAASPGNMAETLRCDVDILLAEKPEISAGVSRGNEVTARAFLLESLEAPPGYGMYSYLLLNPPADDTELRRNINAIAMFLQVIPSTAEMRSILPPNQLSLALLPVTREYRMPRSQMGAAEALASAALVLKFYDYDRAKKLMRDFCVQGQASGPYLIGSRDRDGCRRSRLLLDLTQTLPDLVPHWIRTFYSLAAAERSWGNDTMAELLLKTRKVIAVSYRGAATAAQDLSRAARMLDSQP